MSGWVGMSGWGGRVGWDEWVSEKEWVGWKGGRKFLGRAGLSGQGCVGVAGRWVVGACVCGWGG